MRNPGERATQVNACPAIHSVIVHVAAASFGWRILNRAPTPIGPSERRSTLATVGVH